MVCCILQDWPEDDDQTEVEFRYLCGNTDHSGALEEAGIMDADAIIIGPADDLPDNEVLPAVSHICAHTSAKATASIPLQCRARASPALPGKMHASLASNKLF